MNELINIATSTGKHNESTIKLTSKAVVVHLTNGLSITKNSDRSVWTDGFLTYTITLKNETSSAYKSPIITDFLNPLLISLVESSITINGIPADPTQYSFKSGTIKITLDEVAPNSETVIKFKVAQISKKHFKLKNTAVLTYNNKTIESNSVIVNVIKREKDNWPGCDKPYLG